MAEVKSNPLWFSEPTAPTNQSDTKWFCLDRIYLHGVIEELAGFDLLVSTTPYPPYGIYPVVIDVGGTTYACTAHVWKASSRTQGLVVLNTDKDRLEQAFQKFTNKAEHI